MTFDQLYYYSTLADYLNFTKASESLYISQPTLSRQIALLEEELGVKLLYRDNRSVYLTDAGKLLLIEGKELLRRRDELIAHIQQMITGVRGVLAIASLDLYYKDLYEVYGIYRSRYPNIQFSLHHQNTGFTIDSIISGKADVGICFDFELPENIHEQGIDVLQMHEERFVLITSELNPLASREYIEADELKNETLYFIGRASFPFINNLWESASLSEASSAGLYHPDSIDSVLMQIKTGQGASVVPAPVAREHTSGLVSREIKGLDSSFNTVMIWRRDNPNPALGLFKEIAIECYRK